MLIMLSEAGPQATPANTAQPPTPPPAREIAEEGEAPRLGRPL
jgi:hypothetical protein